MARYSLISSTINFLTTVLLLVLLLTGGALLPSQLHLQLPAVDQPHPQLLPLLSQRQALPPGVSPHAGPLPLLQAAHAGLRLQPAWRPRAGGATAAPRKQLQHTQGQQLQRGVRRRGPCSGSVAHRNRRRAESREPVGHGDFRKGAAGESVELAAPPVGGGDPTFCRLSARESFKLTSSQSRECWSLCYFSVWY